MEIEENKTYSRSDIWIIKFRVFGSAVDFDFYLLFITGDIDRPLTQSEKLCFYGRQSLIKLLNSTGLSITLDQLDHEIDLTYDVNNVLGLLTSKNADSNSIIINSINILLDIIKELKIRLPDEYKSNLYKMAGHLTFDKRFGSFLKKEGILRENLVDIFYWLNGAILSNVHYC